ncbi:CvpA family protein [Candidatus Falkowbacteria bacterium]|uniref:Colicin V production protein n=1 Tax=Candidatus Buchananbacteria bacterium CG10_big_fil_rev_8_21_14_0_10_33_19 TaxID=1974525 RepID=A0A2H0W4B1_9BACT|nr:CvpA family protein [Candidatus Falkowbacteria bacterium]PIS06202.1 MAG: hypothetical protein COT80_01355 [Candidatus Buchananbacteria bacterium CG10_big_fil_rev_8_21_14_0_10_33_19]
MLFTLVDVILVVLVAGFVMLGFIMGLIAVIGSLVGIIIGTWVASSYFLTLSGFINPYLLGHEGIAKTITFMAIFLVVNRLIALIFWFVNKAFNLISIIPFFKSINRFGGAILGFFEGIIITGMTVFIMAKFITSVPWLVNSLNDSKVAHLLVLVTQLLSNFIS